MEFVPDAHEQFVLQLADRARQYGLADLLKTCEHWFCTTVSPTNLVLRFGLGHCVHFKCLVGACVRVANTLPFTTLEVDPNLNLLDRTVERQLLAATRRDSLPGLAVGVSTSSKRSFQTITTVPPSPGPMVKRPCLRRDLVAAYEARYHRKPKTRMTKALIQAALIAPAPALPSPPLALLISPPSLS